jgi:hypothetical protein
MAERNTRRLAPSILQEDLESFSALEAITNYQPANPQYERAQGLTLKNMMETSQAKEVQDAATAKASRDKATDAEWQFHDYIRNTRIQIKAQFGESSDEVQALGLKKKSEYKSPKAQLKPQKP